MAAFQPTKTLYLFVNIVAFEKSHEAGVLDSFDNKYKDDMKNGISQPVKNKKHLLTSRLIVQSPFEFPRQQNEKVPPPEVSEFEASQFLLNSNKALKNGQQEIHLVQQQYQESEASLKCADCDRRVEGRTFFIEEKVYRRNHFRCSECQLSIRHFYYLSSDEKTLCYSCKSLQHPLCKRKLFSY
uniref:LIM zinc-binding domain-containing protein n=1 Tax=Panagrolaimus davidi TaxID=227884 RepID=A0A914Q1X9_9BILA